MVRAEGGGGRRQVGSRSQDDQGRGPDTGRVRATGRGLGPLLSERPSGFWFPLGHPRGYHFTSLGFGCLLCEMKELDRLPPSSKTLGFSCQGDDVTAEFSERAGCGHWTSSPRPALGFTVPAAPTQ